MTTVQRAGSNVHPADELAAIRESIKTLEVREAELRAHLLQASDAERRGDQYLAFVQASSRETIDKASIVAALGRAVVEPYIKVSNIRTLKLARKEDRDG